MRNTLYLLITFLMFFIAGCATTIDLDQHASEEMTRYFKQRAPGQHTRLICSPRLAHYVYQGYPTGLTGSEVKATINIGETFCNLLEQAGSFSSGTSGDRLDLRLDLKKIMFTYSYRGTSLWAEEGREFDAIFILIELVVDSGSKTHEYTLISEKEHYDSPIQNRSVKYTIVNNALEDILLQLYEKVYKDFIP